MPKAVAQKRKTTVAAETSAGRSAGRVTSRSTCHGEAPRAAAASAGRGSSDSQAPPTTRITTEALKNTRPATIAAGAAVEAEAAERAASADQQLEGDPDHDGRQHERHDQERAERRPSGEAEPVEHVRGREPEQAGEDRADGRRSTG